MCLLYVKVLNVYVVKPTNVFFYCPGFHILLSKIVPNQRTRTHVLFCSLIFLPFTINYLIHLAHNFFSVVTHNFLYFFFFKF